MQIDWYEASDIVDRYGPFETSESVVMYKDQRSEASMATVREYLEYLIEYDEENSCVYVSGLTEDGFWEELNCKEGLDDPQSEAGIIRDQIFDALGASFPVTIADVNEFIDFAEEEPINDTDYYDGVIAKVNR